MKNLRELNVKDKKVLVRVDFNVPLDEKFNISDTTRIDAAIPTIKYLLDSGAAVILMSHLGRPKNGPEEKFSLKHLLPYLSEKLDLEVQFADDCIGSQTKEEADKLQAGDVLLLENLRFHKEEKEGDKDFAKKLASLADVYVNDAFGTAHRAHASTAVIAEFMDNKAPGLLLENEIQQLKKVLDKPERPFTAILGGAKVSGKIQVIEHLLDKVDNLIIGGGMMFTFIKAMGGNIGNSLVEDDLLDTVADIMIQADQLGKNIYLPVDTIAAAEFKNDAERKSVRSDEVPESWMGLDIGNGSIDMFTQVILASKTILWNGPMGVFEFENFAKGTREIAHAVAESTKNGAFSLVGGGDSVAAINDFGLSDKISYISTGGGAMLEFCEGKALPGVEALK